MLSEDEIRRRLVAVEALHADTNISRMFNLLVVQTLKIILNESTDIEDREARNLIVDIINRGVQIL